MGARGRFLVPIAAFLALGLGLFWALVGAEGGKRNPATVPSALIGKKAPDFALRPPQGLPAGLATADLAGGVTIVNVFASWCPPCLAEHPLLVELAKDRSIRVYGLNYKDRDERAVAWLAEHGNPFARIGADRDGRVAIEWGVYGVPETFVLDRDGRIAFKHVGPLTPEVVRTELRPVLERLKK